MSGRIRRFCLAVSERVRESPPLSLWSCKPSSPSTGFIVHCLETAVLLALFGTFGAGVADLVEGKLSISCFRQEHHSPETPKPEVIEHIFPRNWCSAI
ncbi:hypothetical protein PIB30_055707 [Stylosanthes scabra]|uniref:Uncharacterized protein n=1 Tax=Stylosanthes scabra TaxID=79078 RepID=A0ABU6WHG7_9FABA|nr:hypothetical protein [Stylosanthes scabra]